MKTCETCAKEFTPKGRQRVCNECKGEGYAVQETQGADAKVEAKTEKKIRPLEKWGSGRVVFQGQSGLIRR